MLATTIGEVDYESIMDHQLEECRSSLPCCVVSLLLVDVGGSRAVRAQNHVRLGKVAKTSVSANQRAPSDDFCVCECRRATTNTHLYCQKYRN